MELASSLDERGNLRSLHGGGVCYVGEDLSGSIARLLPRVELTQPGTGKCS